MKNLVGTVAIDVKKGGMDMRWKNVQEKESNATLQIFGVPSNFCHEGVSSQLLHVMKMEEDKMCANGSQSFDFVGKPLLEINMFFKNQKDRKCQVISTESWQ